MNAQPKKDFKTVRITYQTSMNGKAYEGSNTIVEICGTDVQISRKYAEVQEGYSGTIHLS